MTALAWVGTIGSAFAQSTLDETTADSYLSVTRTLGAESCPDAGTLAAHVRRVRGQLGASATGDYHVSFSRSRETYRAVIRFGEASARELHDRGTSCASLERAVALTLALLRDSDLDARAAQELPAKGGAAPPPSSTLPSAVTPARPAPRSFPQPRLSLAAGGLGLSGASSELALGGVAELGIGVGRFRAGLGSIWLPTRTRALGVGSLDVSLLGGAARMCLAPWLSTRARIDVCSGIYAALISVEAHGFTRNERTEKPWLAVPLELALATEPLPLGFEVAIGALLPLRRHDFAVDNVGVGFESWPLAAMVSLRAVGSWRP